MNKILGIFAASAAALGSAMIASAPVNAQSAVLPVEVEVTPRIFLRTYSDLRFVVNRQDLVGGSSVEQTESYNEKTGVNPLSEVVPGGTPTNTIIKEIPTLFQVWGNVADSDIVIEATEKTLTNGTTTVGGGGFDDEPTSTSSQVITMDVQKGNLRATENANGNDFQEGSATLTFDFTAANTDSNNSASNTYTGGEITIRVTSP